MSIITLEHIKKGYMICETNDYFGSLRNTYSKVPKTVCNQCGTCCKENPGGSFVEFLNFLNHLKNKVDKKIVVENAIKNNLTLLARQNNCIFLENNKCSIYDVRPMACRIFGLESKKAYEENYATISDENQKLKNLFKIKYNINVFDNPKIEYCENGTSVALDKFIKKINEYDLQFLK